MVQSRPARFPAVRLALILIAFSLAACAGGKVTPTTGSYKVGAPYQIKNVWYYPQENPNYDETGLASWYGEQFHGRRTANGEAFDMDLVTAAHKTLPMPTLVRITNLENGRSIVARVNDRGPFVAGRIIDLSRKGAELLGFRTQGTAPVRVTYLGRAPLDPRAPAQDLYATPRGQESIQAAPVAAVSSAALSTPAGVREAPPAPVLRGTTSPLPPVPQAAPRPAAPAAAIGEVVTVPVPARRAVYVQAGAFTSVENAYRLKARLNPVGQTSVAPAQIDGESLFRVRIGPFTNVSDADAMLARVLQLGLQGAKIVVD
ncbi:MAG: septal ring lytic transglycosylase RlpA family protein [Alphaproteobacteria bacterium]|nr:septal ring lytic transglycosylase RlpA family protein [Alphaproteobacteria bacterium]